VRVDGDDLEDAGGEAAEQDPADERHAAPLWPAAAGARSGQLRDGAKLALHDGARLVTEPLRRSEALRRGLRGLIYGSGANYYYRGS
jgi:hypothetical protein